MTVTNIPPSKHPSSFHIGARNIKTSLSVFLCLLLYSLIRRDGVLLACTSAIISMQNDLEKSLKSGLDRLVGTACGALLGMGLLYLKELIPPVVDLTPVITTLGIMLFIVFCNVIHKQEAIVIGCVVILMIVLGQTDQNPFVYSVNRLIDTLAGVVISFAVNRFIRNPKDQEEEAPPPDTGSAAPVTEPSATTETDILASSDPVEDPSPETETPEQTDTPSSAHTQEKEGTV